MRALPHWRCHVRALPHWTRRLVSFMMFGTTVALLPWWRSEMVAAACVFLLVFPVHVTTVGLEHKHEVWEKVWTGFCFEDTTHVALVTTMKKQRRYEWASLPGVCIHKYDVRDFKLLLPLKCTPMNDMLFWTHTCKRNPLTPAWAIQHSHNPGIVSQIR